MKRMIGRGEPKILIFDVDGVLVDVRGTFWLSALDTVRCLTGRRVTYRELHGWKSLPGYNDDWRMISAWATQLGRPTTYEEAREAFTRFYWGVNGKPGNVRNEKLILPARQIERWAGRYELNIFTGRTRKEFNYTFARWPALRHFRNVVTMDDVERSKPDPEGLLRILDRRDPRVALYLGDNIDDATAAREAGVPFLAILPRDVPGYRERAVRFRNLGAIAILPRAVELNHWLDKSR
jgi:HAD superfamily phosphatase